MLYLESFRSNHQMYSSSGISAELLEETAVGSL
jgi:hypothetical protein